jgi:uncharacterized protein (TIGR03086 family)
MHMPTNSNTGHRAAILKTVEIVNTVRVDDLSRPTPCAGWDLIDLLAHMTVQHRGFAAAARGFGADPAIWRPQPLLASIIGDPGGTYAEAAHDVLEAFAVTGTPESTFALPDFGPGATFPGDMAMGFHFVDYVVHGWDVSATLGVPFDLAGDVIAAVLPLAMAVPDGDYRSADGSAFAPALQSVDSGDLDRILRHLGRTPGWNSSRARSA